MSTSSFKKYIDIAFVKNYFLQKDSRSKNVIKNVGLGFIAKGFSILISFLQVPIILSILNKAEYGVWITIFSVTGWLGFFDIGIGNGFRNKLTEALTEGDLKVAKNIISTAYISITAIFSAIIIFFIAISFFIPWENIFKPPFELQSQLYWVVFICIISTALNFIFGLIHTVLAAHHKTGQSSLLFLLSQLMILFFLFYLKIFKTSVSFLFIAGVLSFIPLLLNLIFNIYFFSSKYKKIAPSITGYDKQYLNAIMNLGIMFFIIQIAALIMYTTDNIVITQLYGPENVVTYSLVYRYFSIVNIIFTIIMTPLWTMYISVYKTRNLNWIINSVNNLLKLFYLFIVVVIVMLAFSKIFFHIWLGNSFNPSLLLKLLISTYVLLLIWGNIWVLPLNAMSKIKYQMIISISIAAINIPLIYIMNLFISNVCSVVIGNIICVCIGNLLMYIYYKKTFSNHTVLEYINTPV